MFNKEKRLIVRGNGRWGLYRLLHVSVEQLILFFFNVNIYAIFF